MKRMAYAEFAGKALPTVYEWRYAAPLDFNSDVVLMSNFDGKALAKVGAHRAMSTVGTFDMAGNVKEWTVSPLRDMRFAMGGAWKRVILCVHLFPTRTTPFLRLISLGFRCVKRETPPPRESLRN
jgi:formylglycine-generating enzyme required for sulfatase activity